MFLSGSVCGDANLRPQPNSVHPPGILILLSPSLRVFREEHGGGLQAGRTRGPGLVSGRSGGGSAGPWAGIAAGAAPALETRECSEGEPCCTTVVSFHFPFPRRAVGCSFPGAGFVRVRLDLPGSLFALGMQKGGGKETQTFLADRCLPVFNTPSFIEALSCLRSLCCVMFLSILTSQPGT